METQTLETKTDGPTQKFIKRAIIEPTNTLTANGIDLKCSSRGKLKFWVYQPPREEQSFSELYQNIKTKLVEFYNNLRLKLTYLSRYLPR